MQVVPAIDYLHMEGGSIAGGQTVRIRGRGFGNSVQAVHVDVGGVPCFVAAVHESEIACVVSSGNSTVREMYRGGSGVRITHYENVFSAHP